MAVSQRVGLSIRNHASGGEIVGPHPGRECLPYGAVRNWSERIVKGHVTYMVTNAIPYNSDSDAIDDGDDENEEEEERKVRVVAPCVSGLGCKDRDSLHSSSFLPSGENYRD